MQSAQARAWPTSHGWSQAALITGFVPLVLFVIFILLLFIILSHDNAYTFGTGVESMSYFYDDNWLF